MSFGIRSSLASLGLLGVVVLGGVSVAGCDPASGTGNTPAPAHPVVLATTIASASTTGTTPAPVPTITTTTVVEAPAPAPVPAPAPPKTVKAAPAPAACGEGYYRNVDGNCIPRPVAAPSPPAGATAQCKDGTYSFSAHRSGTCSGHGGVARWL
jgi:hypothetical protein